MPRLRQEQGERLPKKKEGTSGIKRRGPLKEEGEWRGGKRAILLKRGERELKKKSYELNTHSRGIYQNPGVREKTQVLSNIERGKKYNEKSGRGRKKKVLSKPVKEEVRTHAAEVKKSERKLLGCATQGKGSQKKKKKLGRRWDKERLPR